jgi:hypothetical protein
MSRFKRRGIALAVVLALAAAGLYFAFRPSEEPPAAFVPAEGVLLAADGTPVSYTLLYFHPDGEVIPGLTTFPFGSTDEDGKFVVQTGNDNPGIPPGRYSVIVRATAASKLFNKLDSRYADFEKTPVKVVIPKRGTKELTIRLEK